MKRLKPGEQRLEIAHMTFSVSVHHWQFEEKWILARTAMARVIMVEGAAERNWLRRRQFLAKASMSTHAGQLSGV